MPPMRIALCQINPTVGDIAGNAAKHLEFVARAKAAGDRPYYQRRMLQEIEAALEADKSSVASRHVHLANLLARQLRARSLTNL